MKRLFYLLIFMPLFAQAQVITTIAGGGSSLSDGIPATAASLATVAFCSFDKKGNFYFAEALSNPRVRMIDTAGIIHRVAGNGTTGFGGDGGPATNAQFNQINAVIVDSVGNIYISDYVNYRVRKVDALTHIIKTIAGTGVYASNGDGGPATAAAIAPSGLCIDAAGNLFIVDVYSSTIRKINTVGIMTTIAGNGTVGYSGDGGPATAAALTTDNPLWLDNSGNIFFGNVNRIRKINMSTGIITTFAGTGNFAYNGDEISADSANFSCPFAICTDALGNMYIGDYNNQRVRVIDTFHIIHTVAGTGVAGFSGDGGPATAAKIYWPEGLITDSCGNLLIADEMNRRIRKVTFTPSCSLATQNTTIISNLGSIFTYPNPTSSVLHIENIKRNTTYTLQNIIGAIVQNGQLKEGSNTIAIQHLPPGMYLIRINGTEFRKIVKE